MNELTMSKNKNKNKLLPQYKVILHNDPVSDAVKVKERIMEFLHFNEDDAKQKTMEAHTTGTSLLIVTHKELAELYTDQFASCSPPITVTIEPA